MEEDYCGRYEEPKDEEKRSDLFTADHRRCTWRDMTDFSIKRNFVVIFSVKSDDHIRAIDATMIGIISFRLIISAQGACAVTSHLTHAQFIDLLAYFHSSI